jgi:hypothetical protein
VEVLNSDLLYRHGEWYIRPVDKTTTPFEIAS